MVMPGKQGTAEFGESDIEQEMHGTEGGKVDAVR